MKLGIREKRGAWVCFFGILANILLAAGKIFAGLFFGLISVTADGFNNFSDCLGGVAVLVSFFVAGKPADREHPYGHRRAEYIASMVSGMCVLVLAVELLRASVGAVQSGGGEVSWIVYVVLSVSVAVKLGMFALYRIAAKKLEAGALGAAATDSLCDSAATLAVILGGALAPFVPFADGAAGILVSCFIAWQGVKILRDAGNELLGKAPDPALQEQIKRIALEAGVLGVHDLRIYSYGKGASFATLHAEMDASLSALDAHAVADGIEQRVREETGVCLTVHPDPVDLSAPEEELRQQVWETVRGLTEGIALHDLRRTGEGRVEFDVTVPYRCTIAEEELRAAIVSAVKQRLGVEADVRIARE